MPSIADFCPHHNVFRIPGSTDISGKKLKMGKEMVFSLLGIKACNGLLITDTS